MFWAGHGRHLDVGEGEGRGAVRAVGDTLQGAPGVCPPRGQEAGQDVSEVGALLSGAAALQRRQGWIPIRAKVACQ